MHLDRRQLVENGRRVRQLRPVELEVLPRGEVAVAPVIRARHMREHAHLPGVQRAVGNGDPQHVGMQLQVDAVHQAQRLERVLRQFPGEAAVDLVAELLDAALDEGVVEFVVTIHDILRLR
jgi:hypothetical protein